jgi:hypothetical protein
VTAALELASMAMPARGSEPTAARGSTRMLALGPMAARELDWMPTVVRGWMRMAVVAWTPMDVPGWMLMAAVGWTPMHVPG